MQLQKKLGFGFISFGALLIIAMYFLTSGGAFVFTALVGLLAIIFGAFQLMLSALPVANKTPVKNKVKKGHR